MSDVGTEDRDLNADSGIRSHVEAAVAHHAPSPDITSIVNGAVEEHGRNIRDRNDRERSAKEANGSVPDLKNIKPADRLRATIRAAVQDARAKVANASPDQKFLQSGPQKFIHNQPPASWSIEAKAAWPGLPEHVRLSALREQNQNLETFTPILRKHAELEQAIAPYRGIIPKHISEPAAINELLGLYAALKSPEHKATALAVLMNQTGTTFQDIANVVAQAQQQQPQGEQQTQQQQTYQPQQDAQQAAEMEEMLKVRCRQAIFPGRSSDHGQDAAAAWRTLYAD
jgi:hypothetical protein